MGRGTSGLTTRLRVDLKPVDPKIDITRELAGRRLDGVQLLPGDLAHALLDSSQSVPIGFDQGLPQVIPSTTEDAFLEPIESLAVSQHSPHPFQRYLSDGRQFILSQWHSLKGQVARFSAMSLSAELIPMGLAILIPTLMGTPESSLPMFLLGGMMSGGGKSSSDTDLVAVRDGMDQLRNKIPRRKRGAILSTVESLSKSDALAARVMVDQMKAIQMDTLGNLWEGYLEVVTPLAKAWRVDVLVSVTDLLFNLVDTGYYASAHFYLGHLKGKPEGEIIPFSQLARYFLQQYAPFNLIIDHAVQSGRQKDLDFLWNTLVNAVTTEGEPPWYASLFNVMIQKSGILPERALDAVEAMRTNNLMTRYGKRVQELVGRDLLSYSVAFLMGREGDYLASLEENVAARDRMESLGIDVDRLGQGVPARRFEIIDALNVEVKEARIVESAWKQIFIALEKIWGVMKEKERRELYVQLRKAGLGPLSKTMPTDFIETIPKIVEGNEDLSAHERIRILTAVILRTNAKLQERVKDDAELRAADFHLRKVDAVLSMPVMKGLTAKEYRIGLAAKSPFRDIMIGNDGGCCIGVYEHPGNDLYLPLYFENVATQFVEIHRGSNRIGMALLFVAHVPVLDIPLLGINSIEITERMEALLDKSQISQIVDETVQWISEHAENAGIPLVVMSPHSGNTGSSHLPENYTSLMSYPMDRVSRVVDYSDFFYNDGAVSFGSGAHIVHGDVAMVIDAAQAKVAEIREEAKSSSHPARRLVDLMHEKGFLIFDVDAGDGTLLPLHRRIFRALAEHMKRRGDMSADEQLDALLPLMRHWGDAEAYREMTGSIEKYEDGMMSLLGRLKKILAVPHKRYRDVVLDRFLEVGELPSQEELDGSFDELVVDFYRKFHPDLLMRRLAVRLVEANEPMVELIQRELSEAFELIGDGFNRVHGLKLERAKDVMAYLEALVISHEYEPDMIHEYFRWLSTADRNDVIYHLNQPLSVGEFREHADARTGYHGFNIWE